MKYLFLLFSFFVLACQSTDTTSKSVSNTESNVANDLMPNEASTTSERIVATNNTMTYAGYSVRTEENGNGLSILAKAPDGKALEIMNMEMNGQVRQMELMDMNEDDRPELVIVSADEKGGNRVERICLLCLWPHLCEPFLWGAPIRRLCSVQLRDACDGQAL